jgi:hypothetical protein
MQLGATGLLAKPCTSFAVLWTRRTLLDSSSRHSTVDSKDSSGFRNQAQPWVLLLAHVQACCVNMLPRLHHVCDVRIHFAFEDKATPNGSLCHI